MVSEWFRPKILRHIVNNTSLTLRNIFNCLTSDITNHTLLRNRLIQRYGRQQEITEVFAEFGF
jgi:hypothetical protein